MNAQMIRLRVASILFAIFAIVHVIRLLNHVQVTVGSQVIPVWASAPIAAVAALLSLWFWK